MAALGLIASQAGLRSPSASVSASASARFPANVTSQALAMSASSSGFLLAGALRLNHWALSSLLESFQVGFWLGFFVGGLNFAAFLLPVSHDFWSHGLNRRHVVETLFLDSSQHTAMLFHKLSHLHPDTRLDFTITIVPCN